MTPPAKLPRRQPGTHFDQAARYVGRARVPQGVSVWSTDVATVRRLLAALQGARR